jgi:hypothetical protein
MRNSNDNGKKPAQTNFLDDWGWDYNAINQRFSLLVIVEKKKVSLILLFGGRQDLHSTTKRNAFFKQERA